MGIANLTEEEQIAMAIQMSMQDSEMEDSESSRPTTAATDDTMTSPAPMDTDQVRYHSILLHLPTIYCDTLEAVKY